MNTNFPLAFNLFLFNLIKFLFVLSKLIFDHLFYLKLCFICMTAVSYNDSTQFPTNGHTDNGNTLYYSGQI